LKRATLPKRTKLVVWAAAYDNERSVRQNRRTEIWLKSWVLGAEGDDSLQRDKANLRDVIFSQRCRRRFKSSGEWRLVD